MALVTFRDVGLRFAGPMLLDCAGLTLNRGERVCLVGRNGEGKSSLLKLIAGRLEPDEGEITRAQGVRIAMVPQDVPSDLTGTIYGQAASGLAAEGRLLAEYHRVGHQLAAGEGNGLQQKLDRLGHQIEACGGWQIEHRIETVLGRMQLDADAEVDTLSAGMKRRVLLARALVCQPDILLLDEPTNHLDIDAITWLEEFLVREVETLLFVTHDRAFLRKLATRILDLDRGEITSWACDYPTYLDRKEAALEAQTRQQAEFDKKLAEEEAWIRRGMKARRRRNEGRARRLMAMREDRRQRRLQPGAVRMQWQDAQRSGRMVIEAKKVAFAYGTLPIVQNFSTAIMRGDRVGIIGPNGSGKTTLLRVLLGQLTPTGGTIRHGTRLEIAYFDQLHRQLDEEKSVAENVVAGGDSVVVGGQKRHIYGYLQDFLFPPERARSPVWQLSGGERNRLLLAKLFTRQSNVLVMDEPTNDLDTQTLELLEEVLLDYAGTVLLVSHDREFLDNVVTSTMVLEGNGVVKEYAGGYADWLRQRKEETPPETPDKEKPKAAKPRSPQPSGRRLTYKQKQELEALPKQIETLEARQQELHATMAAEDFYQQPRDRIVEATEQLKTVEQELGEVYTRWEELEGLVDP